MSCNPTGSIDDLVESIIHIGYVQGNHEMGGVYNHIEPWHPEVAIQAIESRIQAARIDEVKKHQLDTWGTTAAECSEYMSARLKELSQ